MPYTKHNYQKGDELLASQLNDMDDQIALNEQTADILVTVSNTQPLEEKNRVWVKETPSEIEIPMMEDVDDLSRQISQLDDTVSDELGSEETTDPIIDYTDGYRISTQSATAGKLIEASTYSVSQKIHLANVTELKCYYTGTNPYSTCAFYKADDTYISRGIPSTSTDAITIPDGADYFRFDCMTARKNITVQITVKTGGNVYDAIGTKLNKNLGSVYSGKYLAVNSTGDIHPVSLPVSDAEFNSRIPLFASMFPDFFWVSTNEIAAFSANLSKYDDGTVASKNNAWFQISGNAGDSYVTVISGGNGDVADITAEERTKPFGCVIMYDDGRYYPCNAQYLTDTTFSVYPPLKENITSGELAQIRTGIHLSRRGYRAYSQFLYNIEPKYCEKDLYLAKWRRTDETIPFTYFGESTYNNFGVYTSNILTDYINKIYMAAYQFGKAQSYQTSTANSGIEWTVDIHGLTGYVEFYLGLHGSLTGYEYTNDSAMHCELWVDGIKVDEYVKTSKPCERICLDFNGGQVATLKIYRSNWQDSIMFVSVNEITWWINRKYKTTGKKLFPRGIVVAQLFDSWGEFDDAESAVYLQNEINGDAGVTVPYYNGSKSNQTSAWGKAWFYNKVQANNPSMVITDFGINDLISSTTQNLPETIEGPDGKTYDNVVTQEKYNVNMATICDEAIHNKIDPVVVGVGIPSATTFVKGFIDYHAEEA